MRGLVGSHARLLAGLRGQFDAGHGRRTPVGGDPVESRSAARPGACRTTSSYGSPRCDAGAAGGRGPRHARAGRRAGQARGPPRRYAGAAGADLPAAAARGSDRSEPSAFRDGDTDTSSHRVAGVTLPDLLGPLGDARSSSSSSSCHGRAARSTGPGRAAATAAAARRRWASVTSRSTGRCRRCRAARRSGPGSRSCSAGRLEDLLHVLDEPTIGLHHSDLRRLLDAIVVAARPGADGRARPARRSPWPTTSSRSAPAVATPADAWCSKARPPTLWRADTASGRGFSATDARRHARAVRQLTSGSASPARACATCATSTARSRSDRSR